MTNKYKIFHPKYWFSNKSKRRSISLLGRETMAISYVFDKAYLVKFGLESVSKLKISVNIITDSLSIFNNVTKETSATGGAFNDLL